MEIPTEHLIQWRTKILRLEDRTQFSSTRTMYDRCKYCHYVAPCDKDVLRSMQLSFLEPYCLQLKVGDVWGPYTLGSGTVCCDMYTP